MKKMFRYWKVIYLVGSLIFMGWIMHVGDNEFDRINSQYRTLIRQLDANRIRQAAVEELTAECRKKAYNQAYPERGDCRSWPAAVIAPKAAEIEESRLRARERGFIKVVLFYTGFTVIFLLGPPVVLYLLIVGSIRLYRSIKIVRD